MDADAGPDQSPPSLPTGWIAQWDSSSRKYYFVQISTGVSTWDTPTEPAPTVPTPGSTPAHLLGPFATPVTGDGFNQAGDKTRSVNGVSQTEGETEERGLGSMALSAMMHSNKPQSQQQQAGLQGLVSNFLGSSHPASTNTHASSGANSGLVSQLAGSLLGGSQHKPQSQQQGSYGTSSSGLSSMVGGLLGGHSPGQEQQQGYGYSTNGQNPSGTYTGQAPPPSYPESQSQVHAASPYGPSSGAYNPQYGSQQQHSQAGYSHATHQFNQASQAANGYGQHEQYSQHQHNQYGGAHHGHGAQQHGGFHGGPGGPGGANGGYDQYSSHPGKDSGYGSGGYGAPPLDQYSQHQHNLYGGAPPAPHNGGGYGGNYNGPPAPGWR